jgi:hypothetical protein
MNQKQTESNAPQWTTDLIQSIQSFDGPAHLRFVVENRYLQKDGESEDPEE